MNRLKNKEKRSFGCRPPRVVGFGDRYNAPLKDVVVFDEVETQDERAEISERFPLHGEAEKCAYRELVESKEKKYRHIYPPAVACLRGWIADSYSRIKEVHSSGYAYVLKKIKHVKQTALDIKISDSVEKFCEAHDLKNFLQMSINLARKSFPTAISLSAELSHDPDSDDKWVDLEVAISGNVKDILAAYNNYSSEWVQAVASPQRFMIRMSPNII